MPTDPDSDLERWTPQRRIALVLSLIRGETSVTDAAKTHALTTSQIEDWRRRFLLGAEAALDDERSSRNFRLAAIAILVFWLGLRLAYWNGYYVEDAPGYVTDAIYAALGNYHARDYVTGLNVGTYLPVALPLRLFGKSEFALSLWPLLSSAIGLLSMIGLASLVFGRRYALLAGLLYATYPGDVFFSTVVMPDAIQAGWLTFSMFLVALAYSDRVAHRNLTIAAAGAAMAFCHLIRANGLMLVPVGLVGVLALARIWRRQTGRVVLTGIVSYFVGWLLIQAVEGLVYLWAVGDFFHRFNVVDRHYGTFQSIAQWGLNTDLTTIPFSIIPPALWLFRGGWGTLNQDQAYHGFTFALALASMFVAVIAVRFRHHSIHRRALAGLILGMFWFAWPLIYHQFGSQSLLHFVPIHRLSRHLVVYAPGAVFATVAAVFVIWQAALRWRPASWRRALSAAGLAILAVHLYANWMGEEVAYEAFHRIKNTYVRIRHRLPDNVRTIIGDPGDLCFFDFWMNPLGIERVRLTPFANYVRCDEFPNGVVLTRSNPGWEGLSAPVIVETISRLPCLIAPPPNWRLLYDGFPERIFVVDQK